MMDYARHFSVLGKLCKVYDDAAANEATQKLLVSRTLDQIANGTAEDLPVIMSLLPSLQALGNAVSAGEGTRQSLAIQAAMVYLTSSVFVGDFVFSPPATSAVLDVLTNFALELTNDAKTLGTKTTTGLVLFLDNIRIAAGGTAGTWSTESDSTADYRDAIYVVSTIVAD
jgi:hypothetical protein